MIVLKIIGIVLLIVLIILALILVCPVGIIVSNRGKDFELFVKVLFLKIPINAEQDQPEKPKKPEYKHAEKKPKKKNKGFLQNILDSLGISKLTNFKKDTEKQGFADTIGDTISVITNIIKQIVGLFKHIKIKKLFLNCICGGEDAAQTAMDYGIACAAIYPLSGYLHSIIKVNSRKEQINVQCDFSREDTKFEFETLLSVQVIFIVIAFIKLIFEESRRKAQEMN